MTQIIVIGDLILDCFIRGDINRISPEAPIPILLQRKLEYKVGGAGNVAANCASLIDKVSLIGALAEDKEGKIFQDKIKQYHNIIPYYLPNKLTTHKIRFSQNGHQIMRLDNEIVENISHTKIQTFLEHNEGSEFCIISDYAKGVCYDVEKVIQANPKIKFIIDPKGISFNKYAGAYIITPNEKEFRKTVFDTTDVSEMVKRAQHLLLKLNINYCIITRAEKGALIISEKSFFEIKAKKIKVCDVTGAGDVFISTLACYLVAGYSLKQSSSKAVNNATLSVTMPGTSVIDSYCSIEPTSNYNKKKIISTIKSLKSRKTLAITNGCFDIIHAGHVSFLDKCAKLADILLVLVNSDQSVARLKGKKRPVNSLEQRQAVLMGIKGIDFVLDFDTDTPLELIKELKPDFLAKGGDYELNDIVGKDFVESYGGTVVSIPIEHHISTSDIINKLKQ